MRKILFGGTFDLLHWGHVQQIKKAKEYGYLIVNVSCDKQASRKGKDRPIIPQGERIEMVRSLKYVDEVICTDTDKLQLKELLEIVKPDILITNQGNDAYDEECARQNVRVIKFPRVITKSGLDTTGIINKIKEV